MNIYFTHHSNPCIEDMLLRLIEEYHWDIDTIFMSHIPMHTHKERYEAVLSRVSPIKIEWSDHKKAKFADFDMEAEEMAPITPQLLAAMRGCESVVLDMMERLEPHYRIYTYAERKSMYLRQLRYWNHVIESRKIDLYVSYSVPHMIYDYVLYCLCKLKGIPVLMFHYSHILDVLLLVEGWEEADRYIMKAYRGENLEELGFRKDPEVERMVMAYYRERVLGQKDEKPFYMDPKTRKKLRKAYRLKKKTWSYRWSSFKYMLRDVSSKLFDPNCIYWTLKKRSDSKRLRKNYARYSEKVDLTQPYIYLPLHQQPECSTSPMAGVFVDQILMVEMLASCLPEDAYVYVKEHPMQDGQQRLPDLYRRLASMPRVRLVPTDQDTFGLMRNSLCVATATGTVAWEAFMSGKPALVFGYHYFQSAPGIHAVRSLEDCKQAMSRVLEGNAGSSPEERERFFRALVPAAVRGCVDVSRKTFRLPDEENTDSLYGALTGRMKALGLLGSDSSRKLRGEASSR